MAELRVPYLNTVVLLGRVTLDPVLRYTPRGTPVLEFRIAVNRRFKVDEEWKDETYYFTVVAWAQLAERLADRLKKGSPVAIQGELRSRSWKSEAGEKRSTVEIMARTVALLEKTAAGEPEPAPPAEEETEIPRDQLDDIPF
ncbi:MAG: single-stranded DNA-binding protein [candidate division WOR-3 bacterium]